MTSTVMTIGHSSRSLDEFIGLLVDDRVQFLLDIRTHPGSRKWPHFGQDQLPGSLLAHGIQYLHVPDLGGRRRVDPSAPDAWGGAWRNTSFRAYAQHVQSAAFRTAIAEVAELAAASRPCLMCSESVPWRCHRWLVSDALVVRDVDVQHIIGPGPRRRHALSSFARTEGIQVSYPGPESNAKLTLGPSVPAASH